MAVAAASEEVQRDQHPAQPLPADAEGPQGYARLEQDFAQQPREIDRAETSSSSWGSDAEDLSVADHNSVWTLSFQGADNSLDFADDSTDFQSSAHFSQTDAVQPSSSSQSGAGEPAWVGPWSMTNLSPTRMGKGGKISVSTSDAQAQSVQPDTPFRSEPMSDEHKTAIIGAMKNVKLKYVPRWAMHLNQDQWLDNISSKAKKAESIRRGQKPL